MRNGAVQIGTTVTIGHPEVSELIGTVGFDWVLMDMEHSPLDPMTVENLMQAMGSSRTVPIVRVPWNDLVQIKRALDIGSYGIVVPWVNSRDEAERAVRAVRYPPRGVRGYGPRRAGLLDPQYVETADDQILLAVQIETERGISNIDEILSVEGVDAALVGPADLSLSLGALKRFDSPKFVAAMERFISSCREHDVIPGMLAVDDVRKRIDQGFRLLSIGYDLQILREAAAKILDDAKGALGKRRGL